MIGAKRRKVAYIAVKNSLTAGIYADKRVFSYKSPPERVSCMQYIVEYEICALVFLLAAVVRFYAKRQFPSTQNRIFSCLLLCAVASLSLDIATAYTIEYALRVPIWINIVLNTAFYLVQLALPVLILFYVLAMEGSFRRQHRIRLAAMALPAGVMALLLIVVNPAVGVFFRLDPETGFLHGEWFYALHFVALGYIAVTIAQATRHHARLQRIQYRILCSFLLLMVTTMSVQVAFPRLLLTGVALSLGIVVMYSTLQNPQDMLDTLTPAFNYKAMLLFLSERIKEQKPFHIIAVDIHGISRINRLFGLDSGNQALIGAGGFLVGKRGGVRVFRMMGTRFVAITCDEGEYADLRGAIARRIERTWDVGPTEIMLSATVCCLPGMRGGYSPDEVVNLLEAAFSNADPGRYRGKVFVTDEEALAGLYRIMAVEAALHEALEEGSGLELYFQPVYSVAAKRFTGAEALLRFKHPVLGMISPGEFVPIAEKKGLVLKMDEAVVRMVCEFVLAYDPKNALGLDRLGINLSAAEFLNSQMPKRLLSLLETYRVDPGLIIFEITETTASASRETVSECIGELRQKHIRFAMDDFGTGYANISQVVGLPFDYVKIDSEMLAGSQTLLEGMMRIFRQLGLRTVVEGVETAAQAELLHTMEVDYIQGYYYARPMPVGPFVAFMQAQAAVEEDRVRLG